MSVNPSRTTPQHIGFGYGLRMRLATGAGGYWLRLALFLNDSRSDGSAFADRAYHRKKANSQA